MEYRTLGRSGCAVSSLCLGTMTFGVETDEPGAHQQLDRFLEAGGNFVDTADVYGDGRSEEIIGRWFASRPADVTEPVVLATKGRFPRGRRRLAERRRAVRAPPDPRAGRLAAAARARVGRPVPGARLRPADAARGDAAHAGPVHPGRQDPLLRPVQLHRLAADQGRAPGPGAEPGRAGDAAAAVQPAGAGDRVGDRARLPGRRAWDCCRGARSAAAGCPASTGATSARPGTPGSATTRTAAWRPTTGAAPSAPGTSSTRCRRWPRTAACPWPRSRWPG